MPKSVSGLVFVFLVAIHSVNAQRRQAEPFDVLNYRFEVALDDQTDRIEVKATVTLHYPTTVPEQTILDLATPLNTGLGMHVSKVTVNGNETAYLHEKDLLKISTPQSTMEGDTSEFMISYTGRPDHGLVTSRNKKGGRTFFAEHWPNRAHRWLPVVDHPSEKATCEFRVTAPAQYSVVSNGEKLREELRSDNKKLTVWKMDRPIPTKVMVIGVAKFKTHVLGNDGMTTAWVYDKPSSRALSDFSDAPLIFDMLVDLMGSYPFSKCDHVESTTRFGGMENAGNIFYPERLLTGRQAMNHTIAHEIAHQWFGNSVSEADWAHVWISEGFATFLEYYYVLNHEGEEAFLTKMDQDEQKVLNYQYRFRGRTIVQRNFDPLEDVLNPMVYEKAAWALRMLQAKVGQDTFKKIMLAFYERYQFGNATTEDFIAVAKEFSQVELQDFFHQWFYVPGAPSVDYTSKYRGGKLVLEFHQKSPFTYQLDVTVKLLYEGTSEIKTIAIRQKDQTFSWACEKPDQVLIDPSNVILGEFWRK